MSVHEVDHLTFDDFPAEHCIHLMISKLIESTAAIVRLRTKVAKGPGSRAPGPAMAYKLIAAQAAVASTGRTSSRSAAPRHLQVAVLIENPNHVIT